MDTYLLIIRIYDDMLMNIGALGEIIFHRGYYLYVGSAKKGLDKRVKRHLKHDKRLHWHIDYLTLHIKPIMVALTPFDECRVASLLNDAHFIDKFGSSDCNCRSHLFYFATFDECIRYLDILNA